jgi:hypothetical protein
VAQKILAQKILKVKDPNEIQTKLKLRRLNE